MLFEFSFWSIIYFVLSLIFGLIILMEKKHPVKALAYLAAVWLLPFAGIILYLLFGRDYRKRKLYSRKGALDAQHIAKWKEGALVFKTDNHKELLDSMAPYDKMARMLFSDDQSLLSLCNSVDILRNGEMFFDRLFEDIESALHHIHLEFFIFENGVIADRLAEILINKASEGVRVRIIYDDIGSRKLAKSYIRNLRDNGVEIYSFMPVKFIKFTDKVNYRDHRKIVVIDGKIAYTGGINLSDRYDNRLENSMYWRDTQVRITGDAALSVQLRFLLNWQFVSGLNCLPDSDFFPENSITGSLPMQILAGGPDYDQPGLIDMFALACNLAKERICLTTPYFVPPEVVQRALISAALSGVEVELIIPLKGDSRLLDLANKAFLDDMIDAGVKVYQYQKGFIHAKTLVVDGYFSTVGTTNLDYRSFDIDFEINAVLYDRATAQQLIDHFNDDKSNSKYIDPEEWHSRSFYDKFKESVARVFGPVL